MTWERDCRDELSEADTERAGDGEFDDRGCPPPAWVPTDGFPGHEGPIVGCLGLERRADYLPVAVWLGERVSRRRLGAATPLASGDSSPESEPDEPDELPDSTTMARPMLLPGLAVVCKYVTSYDIISYFSHEPATERRGRIVFTIRRPWKFPRVHYLNAAGGSVSDRVALAF